MKENKLAKNITILLIGIYIVSIGIFIKESQMLNILIALICMMGTIVLYIVNQKLSRLLDDSLYTIIVVFIMVSSLFGSCYGFYEINHYDDFLHLWSGFISASAAYSIIVYFEGRSIKNISTYFIMIYIFMFSMGVASMWEILEFLLDTFFNMNTQAGGLDDTMIDMIDGLIGTIMMMPYIYKRFRKIN
ncbi:MAG: hypothetical protein ACRDD7_13855 [Peptostreptococcaceae bacterium]